MDVTVTARHCELPATLRERAEARLRALERLVSGAVAADVIFDLDHGVSRAEVKLLSAGPASIAHGSGDTLVEAFDAAVDRLTRQLRRRHDRRIAARKEGVAPHVEAEPLA